jgi:hypothetical protein
MTKLILIFWDIASSVHLTCHLSLVWFSSINLHCAKMDWPSSASMNRLLGTPSEEWPGVGGLRDWHEFPQWKPQSLVGVVPTLEPEGVDLLSVSSKACSSC